MMKSELFTRELELIVDEDLRMAVKTFMEENVGDWFYTTGASSTGRYHPKFSQGEHGLVNHTKAVVMFAEELLRLSSYAYMRAEYKDYVIAACILHDTRKYGGTEYDKSCYKNHGHIAASDFADWCYEVYDFVPSEYLLNAIRSHMGQWTEDKDERPFTNIDRCVHLADYIASRNFIDIPSLHTTEGEE